MEIWRCSAYNGHICHHFKDFLLYIYIKHWKSHPHTVCLPSCLQQPWWRHQLETFSALLAIRAGNSPVSGEFPALRPVTRSFYVFFDLCPNKRLSKQMWGWWFETHSLPLWRHGNGPNIELAISRHIGDYAVNSLSLATRHICVHKLGQYRFKWWHVAYSVPSHHLNQCWNTDNWNID